MKKRAMKRTPERTPERTNPEAFWHKMVNPITMLMDRNQDKRISKTN